MKRVNHLFEKILSRDNLRKAIQTVCNSHRWSYYPIKPNKTVIWIESDMEARLDELYKVISEGFVASPVVKKRRYDRNAAKWRDIAEPRLWPDQCVHHALIQVLEPIMMRGMDRWCCGSIKHRGAHYGIRAVKKWMMGKGTKYCIDLDIHHFYDSMNPEKVLGRFKRLIKDYRTLDLIWRIIKDGIQIGSYCSQWFANTFLQPLDQLIRANNAKRYVRYMDNFTIFTNRKRNADKLIALVKEWLADHDLELNENWQKYEIKANMSKSDSHREKMKRRLPNAMGYRYGRGFTLIRKKNLLRMIRQLKKFYMMLERGWRVPIKFAQGLLSRLGMLRHCNSVKLYRNNVRRHTQKRLKNVVRNYYKEVVKKWSTSLEACA